MMQAYNMILDATDEERKKRNRIAKRKSRQRQAQQALVTEKRERLGSVTYSGEFGDESCSNASLSAENCEDQEISLGYSTKLITETGGIWSPVLAPTQISHDNLIEPMNEAYVLEPPALSESSSLDCFGSTSEESVSRIWSGSIDMQPAKLGDLPSPNVPSGGTESATTLWASSTSDFQVRLLQEQQQRGHSSRREPALHRAVITGEEDIVRLLLQHHANVNSRDKNGRTALDLAIDIGDVAIVKILLAHGADIEGS